MVPYCVLCLLRPLHHTLTSSSWPILPVNSEPQYTLFSLWRLLLGIFVCETLMRKPINTVYKCKTGSTKSEMSGVCSRVKEKEVLKGQP